MVASTAAWFLAGGAPIGAGLGNYQYGGGTFPETAPAIIWGNGTPGAFVPFTSVNKGSLYMEVNNTDDTTALWMKVDEGGDTDDWTRVFAEDHALIAGGDVAAGALTVESFETNALTNITTSILVDISAADSETMPLHCAAAATITRVDIIWVEATGTSGAAEGDITIGTASGGAQIVATTGYGLSAAAGSNANLSIASGAMAADATAFQSHDVADSSVGTYHCQYLWDFDS